MRLVIILSAIFLIAVNCDAQAYESEREPQVVLATNFTRPRSAANNKYRILNKYQPTWESLDSRPLPAWYDEAKVGEIIQLKFGVDSVHEIAFRLGIFIHFGVYSSISFGSEWFWTNWKNSKIPSYIEFMNKTQKPGFTYQVEAINQAIKN